MTAVHTFSGRSLHLQAPAPDAIDITDIAHGLSLQCRFAGQIGVFYSVAQHSVLCSYMCEPADALAALLHDAAEAYMSDVPRPAKELAGMQGYIACEKHLTAIILQRFGLSGRLPHSVLVADDVLCLHEAHEFFPVPPAWAKEVDHPMTRIRIQALSPDHAKRQFLERFEELRRHDRWNAVTEQLHGDLS